MDEASRPAGPDWAAIRVEYEARNFPPTDICRRHAITAMQLRYRREREGWIGSRARVVRSSDLINRLFKILNKQISLLEKAVTDPIDKQVKTLTATIQNFETLDRLNAAERNVTPTNKKDMRDLRDKLAKRLDQFKQR